MSLRFCSQSHSPPLPSLNTPSLMNNASPWEAVTAGVAPAIEGVVASGAEGVQRGPLVGVWQVMLAGGSTLRRLSLHTLLRLAGIVIVITIIRIFKALVLTVLKIRFLE